MLQIYFKNYDFRENACEILGNWCPGLVSASGVARAFPGGRLAHPEGQNEEENENSLRKSKKT